MLKKLVTELQSYANPTHASQLARFFKTGPGEYGEGTRFLGLKMGVIRNTAKKYLTLALKELQSLLESEIHEHRLIAVVILEAQYARGSDKEKKAVYDFYIKNARQMNNWDIVDISAPKIVGAHLVDKDWAILKKLVQSRNLWERRIAVLATFTFIRKENFEPTIVLAEMLVADSHDLMHKAVGWMLREVGKRDMAVEEAFLKKYYKTMPRTMLRYAIEKFPEATRQAYLRGVA